MVNKQSRHSAGHRPVCGLRQRLIGLGIALCAAGFGYAAVPAEPKTGHSQDPPVRPVSYADASDEQLTALAAHWDELAAAERRALLSEVKMRMARREAGTNGVLSIRLTRRYGAVPKGHLRIRLGTGATNAKEYGVGFEQRAGQPRNADPKPSKPTVKASPQQVSGPR